MPSPSDIFGEHVATQYESWYGSPEGRWVDALEKEALREQLARVPEAHSVLEVGAGTGHFTRWLRTQGLAAVGLDLSPAMLAQAQGYNSITYVRGDACRLPFAQNALDLVVFITTLEFLGSPREALVDALRVARQGLLLGVLNRWSPLGLQRRLAGLCQPKVYDHARFYGVRELQRLLHSVAGGNALVTWQTTLFPSWWLWTGARQPGGGFTAMALVASDRLSQGSVQHA